MRVSVLFREPIVRLMWSARYAKKHGKQHMHNKRHRFIIAPMLLLFENVEVWRILAWLQRRNKSMIIDDEHHDYAIQTGNQLCHSCLQ